ncbi:MAG: hypothetical protein PHY09_14030 [Desulfuromonadaceae bacterium]|nr:hypothetical protein [Desulfuromonadaceae bacterium]MDD5107757.1 hypothetical protein [Desulfuromonadaceae bacterium]
MILLALTITGITILVVISSATKFGHDWAALREHCEERDAEKLSTMMDDKWQWIMRHLVSAVFGFAFVAYAVSAPAHASQDLLAKLVAIHVTFSLLSVFIESLFVMKISSVGVLK